MTCSPIQLLRHTQDTDGPPACLSEEHTKLHNEIVLILKSGARTTSGFISIFCIFVLQPLEALAPHSTNTLTVLVNL